MDSEELTPATAVAGSEAQLAAIVNSSFDAIISKDLNSVITSWNPAAERLFGWSAAEAIGKSVLMLIPETHQSEEIEIVGKIKRGEMFESYETIRRRKDGGLVWVSLTISPIRGADGRIIGASKIARDITATKESERRIRLLLREVNHRVKNQYAVILSIIRETAKRAENPAGFEVQVRERIMALARSHDLLVTAEWRGAGLTELIQDHLMPFGHEDRIELSGPEVILQPNAVQALGMAVHELGTNSAKHGVLKRGDGQISISWSVDRTGDGNGAFRLTWDEQLADPVDGDSRKGSGFGTVVLRRVTPQALGGSAEIDRQANRIVWTLAANLGEVAVQFPDNGAA